MEKYEVTINAISIDRCDQYERYEVSSKVECNSTFEAAIAVLELIHQYETDSDIHHITSVTVKEV